MFSLYLTLHWKLVLFLGFNKNKLNRLHPVTSQYVLHLDGTVYSSNAAGIAVQTIAIHLVSFLLFFSQVFPGMWTLIHSCDIYKGRLVEHSYCK